MPTWTRVNSPEVPQLPAFAHAAVAGDHVYVSGMIGVTDDLSGVVEGGVGPETRQAFLHVERILRACESTLADGVKVSVFMRIAVGCASLFGARAEFDCVAYHG